MSAKNFRLPAAEIKDVRGFVKRSSHLFVVRSRPNQLSHPRFAAIVGAKTDRTSTGRHKLKRRIREHLRSRPGTWDMIVTVMPAARDLPHKKFLQELEKLLP